MIVLGDYDADGATSAALMVLVLRAMGAADADFLVPNRFMYGYGLTPEIVAVAAESLPDLLITVDNGIASIAGAREAAGHGIEVVITDHHLPGDDLPQAAAIVNPNQPDCAFPDKTLAGVGVAFYVLAAVRRELQQRGWFERQGIEPPSMADYLDLVALGTVADLVPMGPNNRILVEQGLRRIRAGKCRPGIAALLALAGRESTRICTADLGFALGPRLNAAGRLDDISLGIRCLIENDPVQARELANALDELNRDRREIQAGMQAEAQTEAERLLEEQGSAMPWGVTLYRADWHHGLVGLIASRIKDQLHRPVVAFAPAEDGLLRGSGRSIRGFHLRDALALMAARDPKVIERFGGHAMAAGMSVHPDQLSTFRQLFDEVVHELISEDELQRVWTTDGALESSSMNLGFAERLRLAAPWGQGFPEPVFDGRFSLISQRLVGEKHLKMQLSPMGRSRERYDAIAFNIDTTRWPDLAVSEVHCVYRLDVNEYRGIRSVQLLVEALAPTEHLEMIE
jgi:single-stranded-DNA-specific exonuclease